VTFGGEGSASQLTSLAQPGAFPPVDPLIGRWTYRSLINDPDISKDFNSLEFGRGELLVEYVLPGLFIGRLVFSDTYQFRLQGALIPGFPAILRFQGVGDAPDSQDQVYDYLGFLVPPWPQGVDQRPAIVGSTIRTVAHDEGKARAGVVTTFVALKR